MQVTDNRFGGSAVAAPITVARLAASSAGRVRAENLVALGEGLLTPNDVIVFAATEEGKPLRRLRLRQVLLAVPGVGEIRAAFVLSGMADRLGLPAQESNGWTVSWLIDPRASGRRLLAWADVFETHEQPWEGFPVAPMPPVGPWQGTTSTTRQGHK